MTAVNNVQQQALQYKESLDAQSEQAVVNAAAAHAARLREEAQAAVIDETAKRVEANRLEALRVLEAEKDRLRTEFIAERAALQKELTASKEAELRKAEKARQASQDRTSACIAELRSRISMNEDRIYDDEKNSSRDASNHALRERQQARDDGIRDRQYTRLANQVEELNEQVRRQTEDCDRRNNVAE